VNISAVIVTRGDVDMSPILESLPFDDIVVWDNSKREDLGLFGRYAAIAEAKHDVIYTQDDDVLVDCFDQLEQDYRPGVLTTNYPEPYDIPWVARGAIFDSYLPDLAFTRYDLRWERDEWFHKYGCDGVFALLSPEVNVVDYGSVDLPHAFNEGRISTSPGWYTHNRLAIQARCERVPA